MVYFIGTDSGRGPVKIGHALDPNDRLKTLQQGNPAELHILAWLPGDATIEGRLHARFAERRLDGEWFAPMPGLRDFIRAANHFDGFWPEDMESPSIHAVLEVLLPNQPARERCVGQMRQLIAKKGLEEAWFESWSPWGLTRVAAR